ncbi:Sodium/potassium-transporting ATPase subunit alpha [Caligus rogercresseyi]|uniref:Sodium/potassium-transporting ATPase subunit alpha n=1 Tax=Caligus rogercresseyi TaxID=217165 RepID=A0A7T8QVT8_CALRO|nr:Sodium/potassium-transporting ATPase subunit alpha [Caligus rogercresseyi]
MNSNSVKDFETGDAHRISIDELLDRHKSHVKNGLSKEKARENLLKHGYNAFDLPLHSISLSSRVFRASMAPALWLAISSLSVAMISGFLPWSIALRAADVLRGHKKVPPQTAMCIRDGNVKEIRSEEVPADVRIIDADNFWVDNSLITEEAGPSQRNCKRDCGEHGTNTLKAASFRRHRPSSHGKEYSQHISYHFTLPTKTLSSKHCRTGLECYRNTWINTVICTDKTGTLTQNRFSVAHVWLDGQIFTMNEDAQSDTVRNTLGWKCLKSRIALDLPSSKQNNQNAKNHPAPLLETISSFFNLTQVSKAVKRMEKYISLPSQVKVSVHEVDDKLVLFLWGDAKFVLDKCSTLQLDGNDLPLESAMRSSILKDISEVSGMGEKVLVFADISLEKQIPLDDSFDIDSVSALRFIGFLSLHDPPRANVPDAITRCRMTGVKVILTTGESPIVAEGFGRSIGLISMETVHGTEGLGKPMSRILKGDELREIKETELESIILGSPEIIFAGLSPGQKALVVKAYQRIGETVAAIGNGVDDALSLRASDIGASFGGPHEAKSDIFIFDENFASVVYGIEEGILFFDNLSKVVVYSLSSNVPELVSLFPSSYLILFINFGVNMIPAVSLFNEPPEFPPSQRRPRRPKKTRLLNKSTFAHTHITLGLYQLIAGFFGYLRVMTENGFYPSQLLGLSWIWNDHSTNDVMDSYGQEWSYHNRQILQTTAQKYVFESLFGFDHSLWGSRSMGKRNGNILFVSKFLDSITPELRKWVFRCADKNDKWRRGGPTIYLGTKIPPTKWRQAAIEVFSSCNIYIGGK